MKPPSRTTRTTLSRSPSAALICASRLIAQARAAFWPSSTETSAAELALGDELAVGVETKLAGNDQQIAGAHEADIVGDRRGRRRQRNPEIGELLFHRSRPFQSSCAPAMRLTMDAFSSPIGAGVRKWPSLLRRTGGNSIFADGEGSNFHEACAALLAPSRPWRSRAAGRSLAAPAQQPDVDRIRAASRRL